MRIAAARSVKTQKTTHLVKAIKLYLAIKNALLEVRAAATVF